MSFKPLPLSYQGKNNSTGLTIKAQAYLNGVAKAVGVSALTLSELDSTNVPGIYIGSISAAQLVSWGAANGDTVRVEMDATNSGKSSPYPISFTVSSISTDDLDAHLGTQDTAIAAVKSDTAAIKSDLESGSADLANILAAVQAIQNNAGFAMPVPAQLIKPGSGSNTYRIPLTFYNSQNALIDPDGKSVIVSLVNQSGADRGSYLVGSAGSPGTVAATWDSLGQLHVDVSIPSTASQEQLTASFAYAIGGAGTVRKSVTEIVSDVTADGFALQSTLTSVQSDVSAIKSDVENATSGVVAIKTELDAVKIQTDKIGDATIGLSAIKTAVNGVLAEAQNNIEGTGFNATTDSLHAIAAFLTANVYSGGRAF